MAPPPLVLSHAVVAVTVSHSEQAAAARTVRCEFAARRIRPAPLYPVVTRRVGSMDASLRSAQRLLGQLVPHVRATDGPGPSLETLPLAAESPRLVAVSAVERLSGPARRVPGDPVAVFGGFLEGAQTSHVLTHVRGIPIVHGLASAVIRTRRERRLMTWQRQAPYHAALYAPATLLPELWVQLGQSGIDVVDTSAKLGRDDTELSADDAHPRALTDRARRFVELSRERLERGLAEAWCDAEASPLCIDGGISASERVATAPISVGIVKRHHTIYGGTGFVAVLASLDAGERTAAFRLTRQGRAPVLSWYLRLRRASGGDPMWALVRIEVADVETADVEIDDVGIDDVVRDRADDVSRWALAERAPLSLPDPRWAETLYGVRDGKEMLRAIM